MNSFNEFKRLLRNAKVKYEHFENNDSRKKLCIESFRRLHILFTDDAYCKVSSPYRYMKGALGQNRGMIEVMFPAPTVNALLVKLLRYNFITIGELQCITGIHITHPKKKRAKKDPGGSKKKSSGPG